ncbi:MAG: SDR family oxidoreductase [Limibaculum sp.]
MANNQSPNFLFCFGLGYSASRLGRRVRAEGWRVSGTCRGADQKAALNADGYEIALFDRDRPLDDAAAALAGVTHLLSSAPPDEAGDAVLDCHRQQIAAAKTLRWVGYLSTTGVYGDHGGGWVDEETPLTPAGPRGHRRAEAEAGWLDLWRRSGIPVHIFRLAGIYGPGRGPLAKVRAGTARRIVKPGQVFSRIHVEDIATVLEASIERPHPGAIYNVCDDEAAPPEDVIAHAAELLGVPVPAAEPFDEAEMTPMARSFYAESKRVSNARIKSELGVELAYPTYREGLAALLAEEMR